VFLTRSVRGNSIPRKCAPSIKAGSEVHQACSRQTRKEKNVNSPDTTQPSTASCNKCTVALRARHGARTGAMFLPIKYSEAERWLANLGRKIAMQRDVLYHGTRHAKSILSMGVLFSADETGKVSFTRSAEEAAYWALSPRIDDEGRGAIMIFDRLLLRSRYKIQPYHDPIWDSAASWRDEAEEELWGDVINVGEYLIGLVSEPTMNRSDILVRRNRKHRLHTEARLNELLYHIPDWRCRPEEHIGGGEES